ncbi:MAG TPA: glycosyltransferase, partial [Saprospiraceae bacterium]|nr:glycosyltransferase [Saprospiraceae bacterium]
ISRETLLTWVKSNAIRYYGETKDVRPFLKRADCIVLPSYREGLPRVIIESMAMALPVITTDTAGCRETVAEGVNGFLVPIKNTDALAVAIEKFIKMTQGARFMMGQRSRQMVEAEFRDTVIADSILTVVAQSLV